MGLLRSRILRSVIAVLAVWCTGCEAFDPVFAQLSGSLSGIEQGAEASVQARDIVVGAAGDFSVPDETGTGHARDVGDSCDCGCLFCLTVGSVVVASPFLQAPMPRIVVRRALPLLGIEREPSLRPPVRTVAL